MPKQIFFPSVDPAWDFDQDVVRFYAIIEKNAVVCKVTIEALIAYFGAKEPDDAAAIRAFSTNRSQIEDAARDKIEQEWIPGQREIVLGTDDFRRLAPAPEPVRVPRFAPSYSNEFKDNPRLMDAVREANQILSEDLSRGKSHVVARWDTVPGVPISPLFRLTLADSDTDASVQGVFTRDDLEQESYTRFALFRLWDDLLKEKGRKLMMAIQQPASSGG